MSRIWFRLALPLSLVMPSAHAAAQARAGQAVPRFHTKILATDTLQISSPALSPDGKWVVYHNYEFALESLGCPGGGRRAETAYQRRPRGRWTALVSFLSYGSRSRLIARRASWCWTSTRRPGGRWGCRVASRSTKRTDLPSRLTVPGSPISRLACQTATCSSRCLRPVERQPRSPRSPRTSHALANPQFSPDGAWVYFSAINDANRASSLYRVATTGGTPQPVNSNLTFPTNPPNVFPVAGEQKVISFSVSQRKVPC